MNIDIRKHIIKNFTNTNLEEIKSSIEGSIEEKDEVTLPGLGVFFEILWSNCDDEHREYILNTIKNNLK